MTLLEEIILLGLEITGASQGSVLLAEPGGKLLRFASVVSLSPDGAVRALGENLIGQTVPVGEGVTGMAALTHDVQTATRLDSSARFHPVKGDGRPSAVLAAPMLEGDELVGVVTAVSFDRKKVFSPSECRIYARFANVAARVVASAPGAAAESPLGEERVLLEEVSTFARANPGKIEPFRQIIKLLG